jgi:predicted metalloprotease with PDZ domain
MPNGLPEGGDHGLDHTPTWGRTYWGGAMFCLYADVEIRRRTHNQKGLEDAMRAILEKNGNIQTEAELSELLATGDKATGVPVLTELYNAWSAKPVTPDLNSLWKQLGVISTGKTVRFDDDAPLASVRKAITTGIAK